MTTTKTLFLIHGMWVGPWCWDKYIELFESMGYRCVAPYLPYHDVNPTKPPPPELGAASLTEYIGFLEKEIGKLDEPPIIIGHSLGGFLAQSLVSRGFGEAVVLLAPAAPAGVFALEWSAVKVFLPGLLRWGFWKKPYRPSYENIVNGVYHLTPEKERHEIYEKMVYDSGRVAAELGLWLFDPGKAAYVDEEKVKVPMLVVAGAEDRIIPVSVTRKVTAKYKQAEYREFENHAHHLLGQPGWENVATFTLEWIGKLAGRGK